MTKPVNQDAYCRGKHSFKKMPDCVWLQTYCNLSSLYNQNYIIVQLPGNSITVDSFSKVVMYIGRHATFIEWFISVSEMQRESTRMLPLSNLSQLSLCCCRSKKESEGGYLLSSLALYLVIFLHLLSNQIVVVKWYILHSVYETISLTQEKPEK